MSKKHWNKLHTDDSIEKEKSHRKKISEQRTMNKTIGQQIIDSLSEGHQKLQNNEPIRGTVWCRKCKKSQKVNASECFRTGWPKCCNCTMTIDPPETH